MIAGSIKTETKNSHGGEGVARGTQQDGKSKILQCFCNASKIIIRLMERIKIRYRLPGNLPVNQLRTLFVLKAMSFQTEWLTCRMVLH